MKKVLLGAGCFWGVQDILKKQEGVAKTLVGYAGGIISNPSYKDICTGQTGHTEVVQVEFDERKISFVEILSVFFRLHDPTQLNRQGVDIGSQYRSAIYVESETDLNEAKDFIESLDKKKIFENKIVTEVKIGEVFYVGEEYHQDYFDKNPNSGCHFLRPEL
ncbi:MAG: peptide-methionine (S)-S-oxide reductase MsrA [Bacteriovoracaceae bacterium]